MSSDTVVASEEARAFLQARLGLFARVLALASVLGLTAQVVSQWSQSELSIWSVLLALDAGLFVGLALICRAGKRSVRLLRTLEAVVLGLSALCIGVMGRGISGSLEAMTLGAQTPFNPEAQPHFVGFVRSHVALTLHFGLALTVVARAGLVPTRAWQPQRLLL
ncbi:MAG: hypothetical protein JW940_04400 [Polyangiaceae bacterium]|nr:hypothetical protein [Polyangiaceae bacterium]